MALEKQTNSCIAKVGPAYETSAMYNHQQREILKKFANEQLVKLITEHPGESRKEWMLKIFKEAGEKNSRNVNFQFWQQDNQPKVIYTPAFAQQKLEYTHNNPVEAGIVEKAEEYIYSSARDYYYGKQRGLLNIEFLL